MWLRLSQSLQCRPGCLKVTEIHLPLPPSYRTNGMCHYACFESCLEDIWGCGWPNYKAACCTRMHTVDLSTNSIINDLCPRTSVSRFHSVHKNCEFTTSQLVFIPITSCFRSYQEKLFSLEGDKKAVFTWISQTRVSGLDQLWLLFKASLVATKAWQDLMILTLRLYLDNDRIPGWKRQFPDHLLASKLHIRTKDWPSLCMLTLYLTWSSHLVVQLSPWPRHLCLAWCLSLITQADPHRHTELGKSSLRTRLLAAAVTTLWLNHP